MLQSVQHPALRFSSAHLYYKKDNPQHARLELTDITHAKWLRPAFYIIQENAVGGLDTKADAQDERMHSIGQGLQEANQNEDKSQRLAAFNAALTSATVKLQAFLAPEKLGEIVKSLHKSCREAGQIALSRLAETLSHNPQWRIEPNDANQPDAGFKAVLDLAAEGSA